MNDATNDFRFQPGSHVTAAIPQKIKLTTCIASATTFSSSGRRGPSRSPQDLLLVVTCERQLEIARIEGPLERAQRRAVQWPAVRVVDWSLRGWLRQGLGGGVATAAHTAH